MASVDRADYMDNIKVAEVEQTIQKEKGIQRNFFQQQEKLGKLKLRAPTPPQPKQTLKEKHGLPEHLEPILQDPNEAMSLTFSRQLWENAAPGYVVRNPQTTISTMKEDFIWQDEEIEYMKKQRMLDKTFNRRRDEHTHFMECRAFYEAMMGKPGS